MRPVLVGEDNPYSADPRHALFPYPERSAGYRLATPPFTVIDVARAPHFYLLPHPSGLSRAWNEPGAYERARVLLAPILDPLSRVPAEPRCVHIWVDERADIEEPERLVCRYCGREREELLSELP